jgi:hypothetical protein
VSGRRVYEIFRRAVASDRDSARVFAYHNVSKKYLHRYIWQFDFIWNNRDLNAGERTAELIRVTEGKRLRYKAPQA